MEHPDKNWDEKELQCPECGEVSTMEDLIDGWCIKCPECDHRTRGDSGWKEV